MVRREEHGLSVLSGRAAHAVELRELEAYHPLAIRAAIERRMGAAGVVDPVEYLDRLDDEDERRQLVRALSVGVTSFYRDPPAFVALGRVLTQYLANRRSEDEVRTWVAGCASGEEAYSLAATVHECLASAGQPDRAFRVFATDVDPTAIEVARCGWYPEAALRDVAPVVRQRHFIRDRGGFRVAPALRRRVVFGVRDLLATQLADMDVVACRNVLIYLRGAAQQAAVARLHRALRPGGLLFLGTSDAPDGVSGLFQPVDRRAQVYVCQDGGSLSCGGGRRAPAVGPPEELELQVEELAARNEELGAASRALAREATELRRAARDLANLEEVGGLAVIYLDRELRVRRAGLSPLDELVAVGDSLRDCDGPLQRPGVLRAAEDALASGRIHDLRVGGHRGLYRAVRVAPHQDDSGAIDGVLILVSLVPRIEPPFERRAALGRGGIG